MRMKYIVMLLLSLCEYCTVVYNTVVVCVHVCVC